MGLTIPQGADLQGSLDGVIGYSNTAGLQGGVAINDAVATLPGVPPLRTAVAHVTISGDQIHFDPATLETNVGGTLVAGGDYYSSVPRVDAYLETTSFPVSALKDTMSAWFGPAPAFAALADGNITGKISYSHSLAPAPPDAPAPDPWSGSFQFGNASLRIPGIASSLSHAQGAVVFDAQRFTLDRFSARMGVQTVHASYRYNLSAKRPEFLRLELPAATLGQLESALNPAFNFGGILARLRLRRDVPDWLAARNIEGDLLVDRFSVGPAMLGPLAAHFVWESTNLQFASLHVTLPQGVIRAKGTLNIASYSPRLRLEGSATGFPWSGGLLNADGKLETTGAGLDALRNLQAAGTFHGTDVQLGADNTAFDEISGVFDFGSPNGAPNLRLPSVEATQGTDSWTGSGASTADGKLSLDLTNANRQLHLVNAISPAPETTPTLSQQ